MYYNMHIHLYLLYKKKCIGYINISIRKYKYIFCIYFISKSIVDLTQLSKHDYQ